MIVIGGGIVGCSVAYHLTKLGWTDVVLLERKQLTCGTTWHAAGLVRQVLGTYTLTRLAKYSMELFKGLEAETGQATGLKQNGSVGIAVNEARWEEHRRAADLAKACGVEVELITPKEAQALYPILNVDDVIGAVHFPNDGQTNPADTTMALAKGARMGGVQICEDTRVTGIHRRGGRVTGVATGRGDIEAEYVVNCAGMWAREIGLMGGVNIPLHACEHFYIVTEPMDEVPPDLPVLRDMDGCVYYKEDAGKLLIGAFEHNAKPWGMDGIPEDHAFEELPEDLDHLAPVLEGAMHRVPALERVGIRKFFNGPESFTPDVRYHIGEAPDLRNFFVLARLQLDRHPVLGRRRQGARRVDRRRRGAVRPLRARHPAHAAVPEQQDLPLSPRRRVARAGLRHALAVPAVRERARRAHLAAARAARGARRVLRRGGGMGAAQLVRARRRRAAIRIQLQATELVRLFRGRVTGRCARRWGSSIRPRSPSSSSRAAMPRRCCSASAPTTWRCRWTAWSTPNGSTTRAASRLTSPSCGSRRAAFMVVTGGAVAVHDHDWLMRHIPDDANVIVTDVTSGYAVIGVMGPNSRGAPLARHRGCSRERIFPFRRF